MSEPRVALVVGATGIAGVSVSRQLVKAGWKVWGLSRRSRPGLVPSGVESLQADLLDASSVAKALQNVNPHHIFITAWVKRDTEAENIETNSSILRYLFAALDRRGSATSIRHVALVTGLKHYLGPFEAYGKGPKADTPFHETEPRLPVPNFYYAQEDVLFAEANRIGFTWSVHRAHSMFGFAVGNAMNMVSTLSVYATLCKEMKKPFVFPGSVDQWNCATDITDADLVGEQMIWAATNKAGANEAFNVVNGDLIRWRWFWPQIAKYFSLEWEGPTNPPQTLQNTMREWPAAELWQRIATREKLAEADVNELASWWHSDADLGRNVECFADITKSREAGFFNFRSTPKSFFEKVEQYRSASLIPN